ncbi:uncharacterized protein LOC131175840 [Hevea brasiliensis]|uniref:uncharacterized protein LOC131175840 n=1 Tax=Hevea brasiliensis TaxID=3981 RepID=UPI0025F76FF7|nr:uncharacterized protein LOC131175840 [Hevea brasiliensis]
MTDEKKKASETKAGFVGDNPSLQISPVKLDGTNYLAWSRSCLLFIQARGLQGYITKDRKKPESTSSTYSQWESENSLVMSWFINSMQPHIAHGYLLLDSVATIWSAVSQTYSQVRNDAQIYELRNKVHGMKQGHGEKRMCSARSQANVYEAVSVSEDTAITGMFSNEEELITGRMIGSGRLQDGLYLLNDCVNQAMLGQSMGAKKEII